MVLVHLYFWWAPGIILTDVAVENLCQRVGMEPQFGQIILLQNFFLQKGIWIIMELKENLHEFKIDMLFQVNWESLKV